MISSAKPFSGQVNDGLAARDVGQLFPLPCLGADNGAKKAACFPCFAAELVGQENRFISQIPAGAGRGTAKLPHAAGDPGGHIVQRFGRFLRQQGPGLC